METTIVWLYGFILGLYGDNGKENGNYRDYALHSMPLAPGTLLIRLVLQNFCVIYGLGFRVGT